MLWAVLATVVSTLPQAKVASTYDEAACAEAEKAQVREDDGVNCSEPPPSVPAVLDCNDARVSLWLGEMIGSCDMPKPQLPGVQPTVRSAGGEMRVCNDSHCGVDATPLRPAARSFDDLTPLLNASAAPQIFLAAVPHDLTLTLHKSQRDEFRLERPPRSR